MTQADSVHSTQRKTASKIIDFPTPAKPKRPARRKSALAGVRRSGLDLVPHQKTPKDELATHKQCAQMKFKPWKRDPTAMDVLGKDWHSHGIAVRFAYAVMLMSRKKMVKFHAETDPEQVDTMMASFFQKAELLKTVVAMLEAAQLRLIATGCLAVDQGVTGDGKKPVQFEGVRTAPRLMRSAPVKE